MKTIYLHIAALLHLTLASAQNYGNSPSSSSLAPTTTTSTASPVGAAAAGVQTVQVGQTGIVFQPDTIKAGTGDVIEFVIHTSHSVARSSFDSPCQPISGTGIWSGFAKGATTFSVTINDTNPIWLYCAAPEHCQSGMAMVINPP
jgi:plastocyanin